MKTTIFFLLIIFSLNIYAESLKDIKIPDLNEANEVKEIPIPLPKFPRKGMKLVDFLKTIESIKTHIPKEETIIGIKIYNEKRIEITTGKIEGLLKGRGKDYIFLNKENKWFLYNTISWVS